MEPTSEGDEAAETVEPSKIAQSEGGMYGEEAEEKVKEESPQGPSWSSDEEGNLKFVNLVVRCPCVLFWSIFLICFVISFLLIARLTTQEELPFTDPANQFDMDDVRSIQYDSHRLARDEVQSARETLAKAGTEVSIQTETEDFTYWVFESETPSGCFGTREDIQAMKDAFDIFFADPSFQDFCQLQTVDDEERCRPPLSPLTMYYASEWDSELVDSVLVQLKDPEIVELFNSVSLCVLLGLYCELAPTNLTDAEIELVSQLGTDMQEITSHWDMRGELVDDIDQATELAAYLMLIDLFKGQVDFGFDNGFSVDNLVSFYSRGVVLWGGPLNTTGTVDSTQDREEKEEEDEEYRKDFIVDNYLDEMDDQAKGSKHASLNSYYFMGALLLDVLLAIVQRDAMLAIASLLFVFAWLRINTRSWFLSFIGILEIMLSIPVSWFIYNTIFQIKFFAFLNSLSIFIVAAIGADDIFIFLDAYNQSAHRNPENLMSLQARMSWVYRRTGAAMAITSATTCAAFLCTLITPLAEMRSFGIFAAIVIFVDYVLVMTLFCTAVVIYHDYYEGRSFFGCCCTTCGKTNPTPTEQALENLRSVGEDEETGDRVSLFFRNRVSGFINAPVNRIAIFVAFLGWMAVAIWQASQLEATKEAEQFLDEDHPFQKSITILNNEFPTAEDDVGLQVYYTWGLGEVDRSGVNLLFDPENYGSPTYVASFDFNEQCQMDLLAACEKLRTDSKYAGLIKRENGLGLVRCFIEELAEYNTNGDLSDCDSVRQGGFKDESWTVAPADVPELMEGFTEQLTCRDSDPESILGYYEDSLGWDGTSLRYASIAVESEKLDPFSQQPESFTRNEYNGFIDIAKELDALVSPSCGGKVIVTDLDEKFVFMNNQSIYVQTAVQSSILGVALAFTVLLLSTRVLHIAFFASLSIASVLASVVGTMVMLGWFLGAIESILIGIIAGFSVDYVVHLAHAYTTAHGSTEERIRAAFGDMGISVLNGMVTSVGASIPLFLCQLQFFAKFGTFLCLTIAFSWVFANFVFMSALAQLKISIKEGRGFRW